MQITNEAEYDAALARLDPLMDAKLDTPEGRELEEVTRAIEEYEERVWPIGPPTPEDAREFRADREGK